MQVDLRHLDAQARLATVLSLFEQLPQGHGVTLISDSNEPDLLDLLQRQHAGEFDWYPLEAAPARWLLVLARRAAGLPRRRQVLEFMEADHRQIHTLLEGLCTAAAAGKCVEVAEPAAQLQAMLERHIRIEEEVLLPVIAERMGSPRGPAAVLRGEHIQIQALVSSIVDEGAAAAGRCRELSSLLVHHSGMEERILYAVTDLLLTEPERDELVQRCQRL